MSSDEGMAFDTQEFKKQVEATQEEAAKVAELKVAKLEAAKVAKLEAENAKLKAENKLLKASRPSEPLQKRTPPYVCSVSNAAKDESARAQFYSGILQGDPVKGGFVGAAVYREFVLASRDTDKGKEAQIARGKKLELAKALAKRLKEDKEKQSKQASFSFTQPDNEMLQSYTLALILAKLNSNNNIDIGHQFHVIEKIPVDTPILAPVKQGTTADSSSKPANSENWSLGLAAATGSDLDFTIDILVSFSHNCSPAAAIVYKPSNDEPEERIAQCDMYGINLQTKTNRSSIGIDIAGGSDVSAWQIQAWGYFPSNDEASNHYEKSLLFTGSGWDGLVCMVRGLEASGEAVIKDPSAAELKERLGPVVCRDGAFAYKVYDNPIYRLPNLDVVRSMLDPNATASKVGDCTILKMQYFESSWEEEISVEIFCKLATKLKTLHDDYGPHGDIRLANLLSCGLIVDFDYVRKENYPNNLNDDLLDGERHQDVKEAIGQNKVSDLTIKKEHDWHSFSAVMDLFKPTNAEYSDHWENAKKEFKTGKYLNSLQNKKATWSVKLKGSIKIMGSGPTLEKKGNI